MRAFDGNVTQILGCSGLEMPAMEKAPHNLTLNLQCSS